MKEIRKIKDAKNINDVTPDQIVKEKNKIKSISFRGIPRLICVSMIIVGLIQAVAVVIVMVVGIKDGVAIDKAMAITQNLIGENLLSVGIAIVAMAVSIWVGLNIYLSITKEEYETLSKKISEMNQEYEKEKQELEKVKREVMESYLRSQRNVFIWEIDSQRFMYPLAGFLAWMFEQNYDVISAENFQNLYGLEVQYINAAEYYEQNRWQETFSAAKKLITDYRSWSRFGESEAIQWYAKIRIADLLFYCFACQRRSNKVPDEITIRHIERTILDYQDFVQKYEKDIAEYEVERFGTEIGETVAYIYNTIGYSYDLLNQTDDSDESRKKLAVEYMEKAIACLENSESKKKARYLRNLGLTYQRQDDLEKALKRYEASLKIDGTDYKTSVNIASIILLQIERDLEFAGRDKVYLDLDKSALINYRDKLLKAEKMCLMSISNSVSFEDSYYKIAQVYIYLYFAENDGKYLEKAREKLMQLEICGKMTKGFLFTKRNWFEAKGDYKNALAIGNMLESAPNNDVEHMRKLYEEKLNGSEQMCQ